jgi:hypothetical protein
MSFRHFSIALCASFSSEDKNSETFGALSTKSNLPSILSSRILRGLLSNLSCDNSES